jgi:PTH1 family peptidyl-tRNA hydrolase
MKLIVGLGNPGKEYENTRHNVGFCAIDSLAGVLKCDEFQEKKKFKALVTETKIGEEKIILSKPLTYMNLSGEAVVSMMNFYKLKPEDVWIICDDLDFPFGIFKIRLKGGPGSHNGLKSISMLLGSSDYPRFRIGIESRNEDGVPREAKDFVLGRFSKKEEKILVKTISNVSESLVFALEKSLGDAMNKYN